MVFLSLSSVLSFTSTAAQSLFHSSHTERLFSARKFGVAALFKNKTALRSTHGHGRNPWSFMTRYKAFLFHHGKIQRLFYSMYNSFSPIPQISLYLSSHRQKKKKKRNWSNKLSFQKKKLAQGDSSDSGPTSPKWRQLGGRLFIFARQLLRP